MSPSQRVDVLGVGISALNLDSAKETILERLQKREKGYICVTGAHVTDGVGGGYDP